MLLRHVKIKIKTGTSAIVLIAAICPQLVPCGVTSPITADVTGRLSNPLIKKEINISFQEKINKIKKVINTPCSAFGTTNRENAE